MRGRGQHPAARSRATLIGGMMLLSVSVCAEDLSAYQSLLENSPFLTPAFRTQLGRRDRAAVRFLGYTRVDRTWYFGLYDAKAGKSYWLTVGEEEDHIRVDRFNARNERLHISVDGISFQLTLQQD